MTDQSAEHSAVVAQLPALVPQRHGGALYAGGRPGNKGGRRWPSKFLAQLRAELDRAKAPEVVGRIVSGEIEASANDRLRAVEFGASYLVGKPAQALELSGGVELVFRLVRE